jgi:hypothetical protein
MIAFRSTEPVKIDDEEYTLALDIEIIDALEDEFDTPFDKLLPEIIEGRRIGKVSRLLRGLLSRHHPELTLDEAGALGMAHGDIFGEAIGRLIMKASPEQTEAKAENPPKARRGTGVSSSSRGAQRTSRQTNSGSKRREPCS